MIAPPPQWTAIIGLAEEHSNDWVDNHLLAAVHADAVHVLVSEDIKLRKNARRLELGDRVWSLAKALETLRVLTDQPIDPIPNVELVKLFSLNDTEPIFSSLRRDYGGDFDRWLSEKKREGRSALVIRSDNPDDSVAGIVILKQEAEVPGVRAGKTLKLCTFKVGERFGQNRYGELLLKGVFDFISKNSYEMTYFTAFENKAELLGFSESFGFRQGPLRNERGELIAYKDFVVNSEDEMHLSSWDYHVRYGPWTGKIRRAPGFVIPIQPRYYEALFPEDVGQQSLLAPRPCGNGIKKAYLCHAQCTRVQRGDTLFFYQSGLGDLSGIQAICIAEDVLRTSESSHIIRFVGNRTVYTNDEINALCEKEVLAVRLRRIKFLESPITKKQIAKAGILKSHPQSICQVPSNMLTSLADLCHI